MEVTKIKYYTNHSNVHLEVAELFRLQLQTITISHEVTVVSTSIQK
jgi:hypothetical protein